MAIFASAPMGTAQSSPGTHKFEAVSIKRGIDCESIPTGSGGISPGRIQLPCLTVRTLIRTAYGTFAGNSLKSRRVEALGGPSWIDTERYSITAKAEGKAAGPEMLGPMLQLMLEERFNVKVHTEPKETAVYKLTVSGLRLKLRVAKDGACIPIDLNKAQNGPSRGEPKVQYCGTPTLGGSIYKMVSDWFSITMDEFVGTWLPMYVGRPVVNATGLTERFDFHLEFARTLPGASLVNGDLRPDVAGRSEGEDDVPTIFKALRDQLGLTLTPAKVALPVVVIDRVKRPSEN